MSVSKAQASMPRDSEHTEAAKDVVRSFQANLEMLEWEAEQFLDLKQFEMMEVKVASELEWPSKSSNTAERL